MKMPSFGSVIHSVCLLTAVMAVSMAVLIASTSSAYALTFKSGEKKSFNNSTNSDGSGVSTNSKKPTKLLKDLVTQKIKAEDLNDEKLCLSLKYLDLPSTFYEMKRRGLSHRSISAFSFTFHSKMSSSNSRAIDTLFSASGLKNKLPGLSTSLLSPSFLTQVFIIDLSCSATPSSERARRVIPVKLLEQIAKPSLASKLLTI